MLRTEKRVTGVRTGPVSIAAANGVSFVWRQTPMKPGARPPMAMCLRSVAGPSRPRVDAMVSR